MCSSPLRLTASGDVRLKTAFLSDGQRVWVANMRRLLTIRLPPAREPKPTPSPAFNAFRRVIFRIIVHPSFENAILVVICINIIFMCLTHYGETERWLFSQNVAAAIFTAIFGLEAALKILALGFKVYFNSWSNAFDFLLAVGSVAAEGVNLPSVGIVMRIFRLFRLFRLVKYSQRMASILSTLVLSLPGFINVFIVVLFDIFVFSVVGGQASEG